MNLLLLSKYAMKCNQEDCTKAPIYNLKGEKRLYCSTHKLPDMIDVVHYICEFEGCTIRASYGITTKTHCKTHKTDKMIDIVHPQCKNKDCSIRPCFGMRGGKAIYCVEHKLPEMIDLTNIRCAHEGCDTISPVYNTKGGKGKYCFNHKSGDMINVKSKEICKKDGCTTRPSYGIKDGKAEYCHTHRLSDMINLVSERCLHEGCNTQPSYNIKGGVRLYCVIHKLKGMIKVGISVCSHPGCEIHARYDINGGKGKYCKKHKDVGMIDVRSNVCVNDGCYTQPSFGITTRKPTHCFTHKTAEMTDVRNKRCAHEGCNLISPRFNIKSEKTGKFCTTHKTSEMIDVTYTPCNNLNCTSRPTFGIPGHPPSKCLPHRVPGMLRRSNGKCLQCKEPAIYGSQWVPKHCELHKESDEMNLLEKPCASCGLLYILDIHGKCELCNPESFVIARLAKQNALMAYLDSKGLKGNTTDTMLDGGICGKERPDRTYDFGDKIVILECDEHQHRERSCVCEQVRMVNIGQSYGGIPVYFIRFNPDNYSPKSERKYPEQLQKRYKLLSDLLVSIKSGKTILPIALVSYLYMYYDDWSSLAEEEWKVLPAI